MTLSEEQKQTIAQRLSDGASISDIQRLITDEFGGVITFMETRFLIDDLNLELKEPDPEPEVVEEASDTESPSDLPSDAAGGISVEIDKITQPGVSLSGTVAFRDGVSAKWYVDESGRLGLDPEQEGYQPSPEDLQAFQQELHRLMQGPEY